MVQITRLAKKGSTNVYFFRSFFTKKSMIKFLMQVDKLLEFQFKRGHLKKLWSQNFAVLSSTSKILNIWRNVQTRPMVRKIEKNNFLYWFCVRFFRTGWQNKYFCFSKFSMTWYHIYLHHVLQNLRDTSFRNIVIYRS